MGEPWIDASLPDAGITVTTLSGLHLFDAVILATGFDVNLLDRPELRPLAADIMTWGE